MSNAPRPFLTRRSVHWAIAAVTVVAWACDDGGSEPDASVDEAAAAPVLRSIANDAVAPTFAEFRDAADALATAASDHADATASGGDVDGTRDALVAAFETAFTAWQRAEVMQLGPAADGEGVGGEFLREEVYSWPSVNPCRIDQELVAESYGDAGFFDAQLVNVYGFDALEYLVFFEGVENACAPQLDINADGTWAALDEEALRTRRAAFAAVVAGGIAAHAATLAEAWADGGTWNAALSDPASGPYGDVQTAVDEVLRAMFYVDKVLKDVKVARPAGIRDCSADTCPDDSESPYAALSTAAAIANLEGFSRLYHGGTDPAASTGFDDMLRDAGEGALADEVSADIEAAIAALRAVDASFPEALAADAAALDAAHAAIVEVTDDLKGDLPTILRLNIPSEAAGDAD